MRTMLALALLPLLACAAFAQYPTVAIFFDTGYTATNNDVMFPNPVEMYLVLLNGPVDGIRAFEANMRLDGATQVAGGWTWPTGFVQLGGTINNFQVLGQSGAMVPFNAAGMLLGTFTAYWQTGGTIEVGPYQPPGIPGCPVVVDHTGTVMIACGWATGIPPDHGDPDPWFPLATIQGGGVVATEARSLSNVKELFK